MSKPRDKRTPATDAAKTPKAPPPAPARPMEGGQLTKDPQRSSFIEKLDKMANRPFLEGDYMPGPIEGTDVKDRAPKHPKP